MTMKKKTLKKVFSGAAIFLAAANMNGCAYGPPRSEATPVVTRPAEEQMLPKEYDETETTYFPNPAKQNSDDSQEEAPGDGPQELQS